MKTIWKYPLLPTDAKQVLLIPDTSEILTVQVQEGIPCIWVLLNPKDPVNKGISYIILDTGDKIADIFQGKYVGTFQIGKNVHHLFILPSK